MARPDKEDYAARFAQLEEDLDRADSLDTEIELLSTLVDLSGGTPEVRETGRFADYVVRLIEIEPFAHVLRTPMAHLDPELHPEAVERCRAAWRTHLKARPRSVDLALVAAAFLDSGEPNEAEALLRRFLTYKRRRGQVAFHLGQLQLPPEHRIEYLDQARAFGWRDSAIGPRIAWAALNAGDLARASREARAILGVPDGAEQLLEEAARQVDEAYEYAPESLTRESGYDEMLVKFGRIIEAIGRYEAHTILGLVAVKQNRLDDAAQHLLLALPSDPGQQPLGLPSHQPLPEALCRAGRWDVVETYLSRAADTELHPQVNVWLAAVRERVIPMQTERDGRRGQSGEHEPDPP